MPQRDHRQFVDFQPQSQANNQSSIDRYNPCPAQQPVLHNAIKSSDQDFDAEVFDSNVSNSQAAGHASVKDVEFEKYLGGFKTRIAVAGNVPNGLLLRQAFRRCLPPGPSVWKYYVAVIQHVHQLGCNPTPVLESLLEKDGHLLRLVNPLHDMNSLAEFMECLDNILKTKHARAPSKIHCIYGKMAESAARAERSTTEAHDAVLLRLIRHTGRSISYQGPEQLASAIKLSCVLAAKLRDSAENKLLLSHLTQSVHVRKVITSTVSHVAAAPGGFASAERALFYMPRQQLLALVPAITMHLARLARGNRNFAKPRDSRRISTWLQLLQQVDVKANTNKDLLKAAMVQLAKYSFSCDASNMVPPGFLIEAMLLDQEIDAQIPVPTKNSSHFPEQLAEILLQMKEELTTYTKLLDMALPLVAHHAGVDLLSSCIRAMEEQKLPLSTNMNFDVYIAKELDLLHSPADGLSESQLQKRAGTIQACEKLINVLSRMGHALPTRMEEVAGLSGARQFNHLLSRAKANNALPIAYRGADKDLSLTERVTMVHQLAYHYSQDTTRTHREVWRSIYYLYHYLSSNSLPIGPLFTKAVVHSSITRPLSENRFVSARRLIWVCHLVAKVEGDEVASRVENHFYTWRGDLIGRAKRIYVGVGGGKHSKAHVGTMKRLGLI